MQARKILAISLVTAALGVSSPAQQPGIDWSTYLGGTGNESIYETLHLGDGVIAVVGVSDSPTLPAPWSSNRGMGSEDAMVTVLDIDETGSRAAKWSRLFGGRGREFPFDATFDPVFRRITVVGITNSPDFPTTTNAMQPKHNGGWDGFITQFGTSGKMVYSSYLGTSGNDRLTGVGVRNGIVTVCGYTDSGAMPMVGTPYQKSLAGSFDLVVMQLDPSAAPRSQLRASTYLGGTAKEGHYNPNIPIWGWDLSDLHVAADGKVTVIGLSEGPGFPTTANAYQSTFRGGVADLVVARLDTKLSTLTYGTYLGSTLSDRASQIQVSNQGVITLVATSFGSDYPTTRGAYDRVFGGRYDIVISQLDPRLRGASQLRYSTYLGGSGYEQASSIHVEPSTGVLVVTGGTGSSNLPTTSGAFQRSYVGGPGTGLLLRLDPKGQGARDLHYLSYVGQQRFQAKTGSWLGAADLLPDGRIVAVGVTDNPSYPIASTAPQPANGGGNDLTVLVMSMLPGQATRLGTSSPACAPVSFMQVNGAPTPGNQNFQLICAGAPAHGVGLIAVGAPTKNLPVFLGAQLYLTPTITAMLTADASGSVRVSAPVPTNTSFPVGVAAQFLWILRTPCNGAMLTATSALTF